MAGAGREGAGAAHCTSGTVGATLVTFDSVIAEQPPIPFPAAADPAAGYTLLRRNSTSGLRSRWLPPGWPPSSSHPAGSGGLVREAAHAQFEGEPLEPGRALLLLDEVAVQRPRALVLAAEHGPADQGP